MSKLDPDAPDLKQLWSKTRNIKYAAMAIGRWPADPPPWAVIACYAEHQRWEQRTDQGYKREKDGEVLDEVIRIYFRLQDEAQAQPGYLPSTYQPPSQSEVVALALLNIEGVSRESDFENYRARMKAIASRLMEEEEREGFPERASDGARVTKRYDRVLSQWGAEAVGAPDYLHSFILYLGKLASAP